MYLVGEYEKLSRMQIFYYRNLESASCNKLLNC